MPQTLLSRYFYSWGGVAATEHPLASAAALEVLRKGGNAVDATVAASLVLAVVQPHLGGLGGDFFALVRLPDGKMTFIDGSGYAPGKLSIEILKEKGYKEMPKNGPLSINVPGLVDGLRVLWQRHGSMEWRELVKPAINIAERGFGLGYTLARVLSRLCNGDSPLTADPGSRETYCKVEPKVGMHVKFPGLARALKAIAEDPRVFYEGEIAERIASYVSERDGVLSVDDLRKYKATVGQPIHTTYRGYKVYEMPPPTQGVTTLHILKLLEEVDFTRINPRNKDRVRVHLNAYVPAYWARDSYVTDPKYMPITASDLLSNEFIDKLKQRKERAQLLGGEGDTTFFAIIDRNGTIVAAIQSLFYAFGSGLTEPEYQVPLNSRASSFSLDPHHVNALKPYKKTMHTLSAVILEDKEKEKVYSIGLSGGHLRPQLHSLLITNLIDYGMDPAKALDEPRFAWQIESNTITVEEGVNARIEGYEVQQQPYPSRVGVAAIVEYKENGLKAAYTDPRGDGIPLGEL